MRLIRGSFALLLCAAVLTGVGALLAPTTLAEPPAQCPQPPGPPGFECSPCPTYVDPVVCTVICPGGPQQRTFTNQCFASCSGYIFQGECTRTGG